MRRWNADLAALRSPGPLRALVWIAVALAALATGCAETKKAPREAALSGTITYRDHIALPDAARVEIQLVDATDPDQTAPLIAERLVDAPGQVPIAFSLPYDPSALKPDRTYALRVRIRVGDDVWFASPFDLRVLTAGNPPGQVEVQLERVSAGGAVTPPVSARDADPDPPNLDPRVKAARDDARDIDARLDRFDMREITDGPERTGFQQRRLRLWFRGDQPVKLTVSDAAQAGRIAPTTAYYFRDGQLFWVRSNAGGYLFDGGALTVWLDGRLQPVAKADADGLQRNQTRIRAELRSALDSFGTE